MSKRRVVVTGIGAVTSLSCKVDDLWQRILRGESGIGPITRFDVSAFPTRIGGAVKNFSVDQYMSVKEARRMDEFMHYGIAAGVQAMSDSGIDLEKADRDRCGVVTGAGIGGLMTIEDTHQGYVDAGRNPLPGSVGDFSWGGITGTLFWVDPQTKLVAVLMAQTPQAGLNVIWRQTRTMVYQAMIN